MAYMCGDWPYCAGETENLVFAQLVQETGRVIQGRLMTSSQFGTDGLKAPAVWLMYRPMMQSQYEPAEVRSHTMAAVPDTLAQVD